MADFSKEYVEKYMQEWSSDFSIIEEFEKIEEGYCTLQICEGYGFIGITRQNNKLQLIFTREGDEEKQS